MAMLNNQRVNDFSSSKPPCIVDFPKKNINKSHDFPIGFLLKTQFIEDVPTCSYAFPIFLSYLLMIFPWI